MDNILQSGSRTCRNPQYIDNRPASNVDAALTSEDTESDNSDATSTSGTRSPSFAKVNSAVTFTSVASISVSGGRKVPFHLVYTISPRKTLSENASNHHPESCSPLLTEKSSLISVTNGESLSRQLCELTEEVKKLKEGEKDSVRELYRSLHAQADLLEEREGKMEDVEFNAMMLEKRVALAEAQILRMTEMLQKR